MKRSINRISAFIAAVGLFIGCCVALAAATNTTTVSSHTVTSGVTYSKDSFKSEQCAVNGTIHTISFNPEDGYIAMPFAGYAGTSGTLETQYKCAQGSRFGYEVAGVINGGFFGMSNPYGILRDINAYSGRLGSAHLPYTGNDLAFFSDGSIKPVSYTLHSEIQIGGSVYADIVGCFNERKSTQNATDWSTKDQLYYYDSLCGTKCDTYFPGTEIICNKAEDTELSIGYTLVGEVASIQTDSYGGTIGKDQFILYYPNTSAAYASLVQSVKAGDEIKISIKCSDSSANALLSEAIGIIPNIGWLVNDGVNCTNSESVIGTHSVTLATGWTAFGWKDNGTIIYAVSESQNPITMRDMAQYFINMGCAYAVRLDGGGSSAMYLVNTGDGQAGYVYNQGRSVADCMLVLKRSSAVTSECKNTLAAKIAEAEKLVDAEYMSAELLHANSVYESPTSIDADFQHAIMGLSGWRSFESVSWIKQPTDGKSFELEYTFSNCSFTDVRITSLKTGDVIFTDRTSYNGILRFENSNPLKCGYRFRVELIPGGEEDRTHFVLYGDERNVVTFPNAVVMGDLNGDNAVTSDDAIYLLYYTLLPDMFPVNQTVDFDGNGVVTSDDAIYLLFYTLLPDCFPL